MAPPLVALLKERTEPSNSFSMYWRVQAPALLPFGTGIMSSVSMLLITASVQLYFCFQLDANATPDFTIGDDTDLFQFDLPGKFSVRKLYWAMTIWIALTMSSLLSVQ